MAFHYQYQLTLLTTTDQFSNKVSISSAIKSNIGQKEKDSFLRKRKVQKGERKGDGENKEQ